MNFVAFLTFCAMFSNIKAVIEPVLLFFSSYQIRYPAFFPSTWLRSSDYIINNKKELITDVFSLCKLSSSLYWITHNSWNIIQKRVRCSVLFSPRWALTHLFITVVLLFLGGASPPLSQPFSAPALGPAGGLFRHSSQCPSGASPTVQTAHIAARIFIFLLLLIWPWRTEILVLRAGRGRRGEKKQRYFTLGSDSGAITNQRTVWF